MNAVFTYEQFSHIPLGERIDWIDALDLLQIKHHYEAKVIKKFFNHLFEFETNSYLRLKAVEYISELTLLDFISYEFTKDFLLEDVSTGDSFIDSVRLKYLFLLYGDDQRCYNIFKIEAQNQNSELASEACYRIGLVHLLYKANHTMYETIILELEQAKYWFDLSFRLTENRVDAYFFSLTSQYLLSLLGLDPYSSDTFFEKLTDVLLEKRIWSYASAQNVLENRIYQSLYNLRVIVKKVSEEKLWTNYKKNFLILSNCLNELLFNEALSTRFINSINSFNENPLNAVLEKYYIQNFSACSLKIDAIIENADSSEQQLIDFLSDLKARLATQNEKKNDIPVNSVAVLCSSFSQIDASIIIYDVKQLVDQGKSDLQIQAQLAIKYSSRFRLDQVSYSTGYLVSDEVLQLLKGGLLKCLPAYDPYKMAIFINVLSDLIRYAYQAETLPKKFFPHLYDSTIKLEEIFQNHLYTKLVAGDRALNYHYEESDVVGASRLDIVYRENDLVFPIEVKKTDKIPDWEAVKRGFVAQVQMYNRPYNQLGFLVIFDISPKKDSAPLNDIRSLVEILHMTPYYPIVEKYPDYVVAIIIPANKISPSVYTTYH